MIREDIVIDHSRSNLLHTVLLLGSMMGLLALLGFLLSGTTGVVMALAAGVFLFFFGPRISPQLLLRMYRARALSSNEAPQLYRIVQELARRANLKFMPKLFYIPSPVMNAFAAGTRNQAVIAVTDGLLRKMDLAELSGVLAHEMSHIRNNDMRVMGIADLVGRMTGTFSLFGQLLLFINLPLLLMGEVAISWIAIILLIFAPTLSNLLQMALSRTREFDADLGAAQLTGDPAGLASALRKLEYYQGNLWQRIVFPGQRSPEPSLLRTHPPTAERVKRLLALKDDFGYSQPPYQTISNDDISGVFSSVQRNPRWHMMGFWY